MDKVVRGYIDVIAPGHRPLDRLHWLIVALYPDAAVVLSYQIPTYKVGNSRLYVGTWKHGLSIYGWEQGRAAGFIARHPALKTCKGTIQMRTADAAAISMRTAPRHGRPRVLLERHRDRRGGRSARNAGMDDVVRA
jgi:hypothetical protein